MANTSLKKPRKPKRKPASDKRRPAIAKRWLGLPPRPGRYYSLLGISEAGY